MNGNSKQIRGKAYPTIRELRVAQALGDHAVVGSLCTPTDPFGPVFTVLDGRLHSPHEVICGESCSAIPS